MKIYRYMTFATFLGVFLYVYNYRLSAKRPIPAGKNLAPFVDSDLRELRKKQSNDSSDIEKPFLVSKLERYYSSIKQYYVTFQDGNIYTIRLFVPVLSDSINAQTNASLHSVIPIYGNYSLLFRLNSSKSSSCENNCNIKIDTSYSVETNLNMNIANKQLCSNKPCFYVGTASYDLRVQLQNNKYKISLHKWLGNFNPIKLFSKVYSSSIFFDSLIQDRDYFMTSKDSSAVYFQIEPKDLPGLVLTTIEVLNPCSDD